MESLKDKAWNLWRKVRNQANRIPNLIFNPVIVLLYHRIEKIQNDPHKICVSQENFRAQMKWLKDEFSVIPFRNVFEEDSSKISFAITFDDGYDDNYLNALPILEDLNSHATFFVTTQPIVEKSEFWWDQLSFIFIDNPTNQKPFKIKGLEHFESWPTQTTSDRKRLHEQIHRLLKTQSHKTRSELLTRIKDWSGLSLSVRSDHAPLSMDHLLKLASSSNAEVGAHTLSHSALNFLSPEDQEIEIKTAAQNLRDWTGKEVKTFAYPFGGRTDYNQSSVKIVKQNQFSIAASNFEGHVRPWTSHFEVPRYIVRDSNLVEFQNQIRSIIPQ